MDWIVLLVLWQTWVVSPFLPKPTVDRQQHCDVNSKRTIWNKALCWEKPFFLPPPFPIPAQLRASCFLLAKRSDSQTAKQRKRCLPLLSMSLLAPKASVETIRGAWRLCAPCQSATFQHLLAGQIHETVSGKMLGMRSNSFPELISWFAMFAQYLGEVKSPTANHLGNWLTGFESTLQRLARDSCG